MKTLRTPVLVACTALSAASPLTAEDKPKVAWELTEGVKAPESAYYDAKTGHIFLSQIGEGGGMAKDGDGWISILTPDGAVVKNRWHTGLNAPKGLRSSGGVLWVSDIDRLVGINISNGKTHRIEEIKGAKFLNDVATSSDGTVYVSDMLASTIYQLREGKVSKLAAGPHLDSPNGLLAVEKTLYLAGWGKDINDSFATATAGRLLAYNLSSGKLKAITPTPTGNLDGLEVDGMGGFVVTDWIAGKVFHITGEGKVRTILELPKGAADIAYLADRKLLIVPRMLENRVTAYDLSGVLK